MAGPEARIVKKIREHLERNYPDIFFFKVWGNEQQMSGLPDLIGCWQGRFFGLEVKTPETHGRLTERQKYVMRKIERAGGVVGVVTSTDDADVILRSIPKQSR